MSNLLISEQMAKGLFDEPSVAELYRTERSVVDSITFFQKAMRMARTANPSTLKILGRVLKAASFGMGYLQILRPPRSVQAQGALAILKTSMLEAANVLLTFAGDPQRAGNVQILISDAAIQTLTKLEKYDPAFIHLVPVQTQFGNLIRIEGGGISQDDITSSALLVEGILEDIELILGGIIFPVETLL